MKNFVKLLLLGIAFGIIEASVVVYLRPLFNGSITDFSLQVLPIQVIDSEFKQIIITEIWREVATLLLIFAAAWLAAKHWWEGVCYFVFLFGVWDIVYYIWLYVRIGWPASIMEWDILFLIPQAWYGPVIVPVIISLLGMLTAMVVVYAFEKRIGFKIKPLYIILVLAAFVIWYFSFTHQVEVGQTEFPEQYSWLMFFGGVGLTTLTLLLMLFDIRKLHLKTPSDV
ncbi:MAG: hypothetical protein KJO64_05745 [Bacteroidia bacterium]|nr:hypothetical protein [Bacteroidia bacterium]